MTWPGCLLIYSRLACGVHNKKYDSFSDYVACAPIKRVVFCSAQRCSEVARYDSAQPDGRSVRSLRLHTNTHCIMYGYIIRFSYNIVTLTLRRLMSYIYGAPILDVSRSHTTTQHSR